MPIIVIDLAQTDCAYSHVLSLRRARVACADVAFIDTEHKVLCYVPYSELVAVMDGAYGVTSSIARHAPIANADHAHNFNQFHNLTDGYDDAYLSFYTRFVISGFTPHAPVGHSMSIANFAFSLNRIAFPLFEDYREIGFAALCEIINLRYSTESPIGAYFRTFHNNRSITPRKFPTLGPYNHVTTLALRKYSRGVVGASTGQIGIIKSSLTAEEMIGLLTTNVPDDDFINGFTFPFPLVKTLETISSPNFRVGAYHPRSRRFKVRKDDATDVLGLQYRFHSTHVIFIKESCYHPDFRYTIPMHIAYDFSGDFGCLQEEPLGARVRIDAVPPVPDDLLDDTVAVGQEMLAKPFGVLAIERFLNVADHRSVSVLKDGKFVAFRSQTSEVAVEAGRESALLSNIKNSQTTLDTIQNNIASYQQMIAQQENNRAWYLSIIQRDEETLKGLSIDYASTDTALQEIVDLANGRDVKVSDSFKAMLESLRTFHAYLSAIFFSAEVSATYDVDKKTYMLKSGSHVVRPISVSELYVKAAYNGGFTGAEITFTKPFVNTCISRNGTVNFAYSYILYPFVFRYNEQGGAVLASTRHVSMKRDGVYGKIHPHLRSVSLTNDLSFTHYSFGWQQENAPSETKLWDAGAAPCLGTLASHISTALNNKDLAFLVRGMLGWATSNAGPEDTWSDECRRYTNVSLKNILIGDAPYQSLELDSVYFDKSKHKTYLLFADPIYKERDHWMKQVPQHIETTESARFHLHEVPCKFDPDTSVLTFDITDVSGKTLLSTSATKRLRRLGTAILLQKPTFTTLETSATITIPSTVAAAPSAESASVF